MSDCTDSAPFLSGPYNVMNDATEAYKRVYEQIGLLAQKEEVE